MLVDFQGFAIKESRLSYVLATLAYLLHPFFWGGGGAFMAMEPFTAFL